MTEHSDFSYLVLSESEDVIWVMQISFITSLGVILKKLLPQERMNNSNSGLRP